MEPSCGTKCAPSKSSRSFLRCYRPPSRLTGGIWRSGMDRMGLLDTPNGGNLGEEWIGASRVSTAGRRYSQNVFVLADREPFNLSECGVFQVLAQLLSEVSSASLVVRKRYPQAFDRRTTIRAFLKKLPSIRGVGILRHQKDSLFAEPLVLLPSRRPPRRPTQRHEKLSGAKDQSLRSWSGSFFLVTSSTIASPAGVTTYAC